MKVIFKDLKHGEIKLVPENLDDIWHLYNVIDEGDLVRGVTFRTDEQKDDKIRSKKTEKKKRIKTAAKIKRFQMNIQFTPGFFVDCKDNSNCSAYTSCSNLLILSLLLAVFRRV